MAFKIIIFAAALSLANAGFLPGATIAQQYSSAPDVSTSYFNQGLVSPVAIAHAHTAPIAYNTHLAPVHLHGPSVGQSHQSVVRSPLGGSISQYSKAIDSAYSSVRKFDTRITNDALAVPHVHQVAAYAPAPIVQRYTHAHPISVAPTPIVQSYAHPVVPRYAQNVLPSYAQQPGAVVSHVTFTGLGTSYEW